MSGDLKWLRDETQVRKMIDYLQQENEVLHTKVAKLEISLASEREACAKVAEEYKPARKNAFL